MAASASAMFSAVKVQAFSSNNVFRSRATRRAISFQWPGRDGVTEVRPEQRDVALLGGSDFADRQLLSRHNTAEGNQRVDS